MKLRRIRSAAALLLAAVLAVGAGCSTGDGDRPRSRQERSSVSSRSTEGLNVAENSNVTLESTTMYVTGISEKAAVRESDEDNGKVLVQLSLGDEVRVISSDSSTSYYVSCGNGDIEGYIKKPYLTNEKSAVCKDELYFASAKTSVYDKNDADRKEIQTIDKNTQIIVMAKNSGDFWFVNVKDTKNYGFVKCTDISSKKIEEPSAASSKATSSKPAVSSSAPVQSRSSDGNQQRGYYTGYSNTAPTNYSVYYAKVATGYLAIRSAKAYDVSNELGKMYTGDAVYVVDTSTGTYWYCYSPKLATYGYVNSDYLTTSYSNPTQTTPKVTDTNYSVWEVSVNGYLALRTAKAYDASNEIGKLYTGDVVYVYSYSYVNFTDVYWYVYAPSLGKWGYVNSNYIYS